MPGDVVLTKTLKCRTRLNRKILYDHDNFKCIIYLVKKMAFEFLNCLNVWVYIGIFASILVLGLLSVAKQCSWKEFFDSIWNFASITLSDAMTFAHNISGINRVLVMVWLFANTILFSLISGQSKSQFTSYVRSSLNENNQFFNDLETYLPRVEIFQTKRNI